MKNPLVISACPVTGKIDWLKKLEEAGAAAAVMPSLFEEQIEHDEVEMTKLHEFGTESFAEARTYFPDEEDYRTGPEEYLAAIAEAKRAVKMPIIASFNGTTTGGWVRYAKMMQEAGADAVELNIYYIAADADMTSGCDVEAQLSRPGGRGETVDLDPAWPSRSGRISAPWRTWAKRLAEAGADGLVLFNRFFQPDIDLETLETKPKLQLERSFRIAGCRCAGWRFCTAASTPRWPPPAASTTPHSGSLKALLAGADVGMIASVIYQDGFEQVGRILRGLQEWMKEKEYDSIEQLKGSISQANCPDPEAFARGNYMKALTTYTGRPI